ncbi:hypothetical protein EJ02DRAFT_459000 [Clathrospora elynae]|uniref:Uncharacterized protein n=1 Tax=Clathrospora elynae TaxID=706981 RepID=A0A6A5SBP4_9PLEO|nr:hypothetical protein EJ02DRAFT_459000 [Clathrospora elynae]
MASETPASPTLDPQLYEEWDDEDDLRWKNPLNALINNTQTPREAAQSIDNLLRADTSERLQKLVEYANSHDMATEERESGDWGDLPPPNAGAMAEQLLRWYARVCTAFSPYSEGQNRLIELLEELKDLPRWMAPDGRPDEDGNVTESEFWRFGRSWIGLEDAFRRYHVEVKPGYYRDAAAHNRWRNFQHTMARLTAGDLIYCAPWNALQDILPSSEPKPDAKRSLEFDIVAAAQWVGWPDECRYVYQECMKKETTTHPHYWEPFSKQNWARWKKEFGLVVESELYDDQTKNVARQALERMKNTEEEFDEECSVGSNSD